MKKIILLIVLSYSFASHAFAQDNENFRMILKDDWQMQSALKDPSPGSNISQSQFEPKSWYKISVPSTVIAGLLANHVYDFDPFFGMNFEKLNDPASGSSMVVQEGI